MTDEAIQEVIKECNKVEESRWFKEMDKVEVLIKEGTWRRMRGYYKYKERVILIAGDYPVGDVLRTLRHECAHHIEFRHAPGFIRYKGVIHSKNFYTILERLTDAIFNPEISLKEVTKDLESYPVYEECGWKWSDERKTKMEFVKTID